jgi:transposase
MAQRVQGVWRGTFSCKGNLKLSPEQEKIHELEKRLKDAELERDILKKKSAFFPRAVDDL